MVQQQEKTFFQLDPTDACLNKGGKGQTTGEESCCSYMHIYELEIAFGLESGYKMWLKQCITVCTSWRECLWELESLNKEQMLVLRHPVGEAFIFVTVPLLYFSDVSLLILVCAARSPEWAVKYRLRAYKDTNPFTAFVQVHPFLIVFSLVAYLVLNVAEKQYILKFTSQRH